MVLSLVLYKMVDANAEVREDALHMLQVLSMREWQTSATDLAAAAGGALSRSHARMQDDSFTAEAVDASDSVMVLGALQDSYQQFQYELAVSLARCAPLFLLVCTPLCSKVLQLANPFCQPSRSAILPCWAVVTGHHASACHLEHSLSHAVSFRAPTRTLLVLRTGTVLS